MLSTITAMITARADRAVARRRYTDRTESLHEALDALRTTRDRDERAVLLDTAADVVTELANLHATAWGRDEDAAGRPAVVSLDNVAWLLRRVADTERAVVTGHLVHREDDPEAEDAELRVWLQLAGTDDPAERADHLRTLHGHCWGLGDRARQVLLVVADTEEHLAAGAPAFQPRPERRVLPRVLVAAVLALLAAPALVPGLDPLERVQLQVTVLPVAFGVLWLALRRL